MRINHFSQLLVLGAVLVVTSCDSEDNLAGCSGSVAAETQQGNTINATGSFKGGQPLMRLTQNGVNQTVVSGNYGDNDAAFDVSGITKGTYTVTWILSCNNGGEVVMTSGVKTITVT